jgi:hypothetical protein
MHSTKPEFLVSDAALRWDKRVECNLTEAGRLVMKFFEICSAVAFCALFPLLGAAQNTARVECPRDDGYVYLYSSMITLEVRATLQCGSIVQLTGRYNSYYGVRTAKNEVGYVPLGSIVVLKDQPGTGLPAVEPPPRERLHYDEGPRVAPAPAPVTGPVFTLLNDTPIRVKLLKTISSANAHVGDPVEFDVDQDVFVEGVPVVMKGAKAIGVVADTEPKKRFGHGGKLAFRITSVQLADGEQAKVRCYQEATGSSNTSSDAVLPLASGKDVAIVQDVEFTALVDGDVHLKRESFASSKGASPVNPPMPAEVPQPQR